MSVVNVNVSVEEALKLAATSTLFFAYYFLPDTFVLAPGEYHQRLFHDLDNLEAPTTGLGIFRDGGKTTCLRAWELRRACFGLSEFLVYVNESEGRAMQTVDWFKHQIQHNRRLSVFGMSVGSVSNLTELRVRRPWTNLEYIVKGLGITGPIRGQNIQDRRPTTLILDDVCTESTGGTPETRAILNQLVFGAAQPSLAAQSMAPAASLVVANTRLAEDDPLGLMMKDPKCRVLEYSVFNDQGQSTWPAKWTTDELKEMKESATQIGMLGQWLRERENKLVRVAATEFPKIWLRTAVRHEMLTHPMVLSVDPVPPPKQGEVQTDAKLARRDFEVWLVAAYAPGGRVAFIDERANRGHDPLWSWNTFCELCTMYPRIRALAVETYGFQRVLAFFLREKMREHRMYRVIHEMEERIDKPTRIRNAFGLVAPVRGTEPLLSIDPVFCPQLHEQFQTFPGSSKDDALDSAASNIVVARRLSLLHMPYDDDDNDAGREAAILKELRDSERNISASRAPGVP